MELDDTLLILLSQDQVGFNQNGFYKDLSVTSINGKLANGWHFGLHEYAEAMMGIFRRVYLSATSILLLRDGAC